MSWKKPTRWVMLAGVWTLAIGGLSGCNLLAPLYFAAILAGMDERVPPPVLIPVDQEAERNIRVAVLTHVPVTTRPELAQVDRDLNSLISMKLFQGFSADKKKIDVITARRVANWQSDHPDWHSMELEAIGQELNADYLIFVEIESLAFYQDGPTRHLYQGKAEVNVKLVPIREQTGADAFEDQSLTLEFPKGRAIPVDNDRSFKQFRQEFLNRLAERISWLFLPHGREDEYGRDPS